MPRLEGLPPIEAVRNNLLDLIERLDPEGEDVLSGVLSPAEIELLDSAWHLLHSEAQPGRDYRVGITVPHPSGKCPCIVLAADVTIEEAARVFRGAHAIYSGGNVAECRPGINTIPAGAAVLQILIRSEQAEDEKAARDQEHAERIAARAWADLDPEGDAAQRAAELRKDLARFAGMFATLTGSGFLVCPLEGPEAEAWEQGAAEIKAGFWNGIEAAQALEPDPLTFRVPEDEAELAAALEASAFPEAQPVTLAQYIDQRGAQALAERKPSPEHLTGDGVEEAAAYSDGARFYEAGRVAFQNGIVRSNYPMPLRQTDPATLSLCDRWLEGWDAAQREAEGSADQ